MFLYILIIFVLYGWIEFEILMLVSDQIGGLASFLGVFVTAIIGVSLLKSQSRQVMQGLQAGAQPHGGKIVTSLASGISLLLGALLMLLPGYFTDAVGIICFIPGIRTVIGSIILLRLSKVNIAAMGTSFGNRAGFGFTSASFDEAQPKSPHPDDDEQIIEGDFTEKTLSKKS
jgi:UPF0716 protein FxsA